MAPRAPVGSGYGAAECLPPSDLGALHRRDPISLASVHLPERLWDRSHVYPEAPQGHSDETANVEVMGKLKSA